MWNQTQDRFPVTNMTLGATRKKELPCSLVTSVDGQAKKTTPTLRTICRPPIGANALGDIYISVFGATTEVHERARMGRWPGKKATKTETIYCWKKTKSPKTKNNQKRKR